MGTTTVLRTSLRKFACMFSYDGHLIALTWCEMAYSSSAAGKLRQEMRRIRSMASVGAVRGQHIWGPGTGLSLHSPVTHPLPFFPCPLFRLFPLRGSPLKGGLVNRCKLSQQGVGRSPSGNRILCISALKSDTWWHQIYSFF